VDKRTEMRREERENKKISWKNGRKIKGIRSTELEFLKNLWGLGTE
jgi:hypothetical protein